MTRKTPDITEQLTNAADNIDEMSRTELQVLLRLSAVTIARLREVIETMGERLQKQEPPIGEA